MTGIRLRVWEGSRRLHSACLDVAGTAACLDAARERAEGLRERGQVSGLTRGFVLRRFGPRWGRRLRAGRPIEHIELPNGWEVRYKIWNTGLGKGKRYRQFVSLAGTFLRSKRELMAHLYLNTLAPQPPHDY